MSQHRPTPLSPEWETALAGRLQIFANHWLSFKGTEMAGAQEYLRTLLDIYDVSSPPGSIFEQHPVQVRAPDRRSKQESLFGEPEIEYTVERMDMYLPKICVWEMKGPSETNLEKHHPQLLGYWARMRPRYMVLCNFHELWIYDTSEEQGQLSPKLKLGLKDLPGYGDALLFLRGGEAELDKRSADITKEVAAHMGRLFRALVEPPMQTARDRAAKFVLECVFAMFAEDAELIPAKLFTNKAREADAAGTMDAVFSLFDDFGRDDPRDRANPLAPYINGPLFDRNHPKVALPPSLIHDLYCTAKDYDWQDVRPEIFGEIFEKALDPAQRHELGAHFTRQEDIDRVVLPTVIEPWRQRIAAVRTPKDAQRVVDEMRAFHVLDPACGCGNFLYVVFREMKRLESALVVAWTCAYRTVARTKRDIPPPPQRPYFSLDQIHGIEKNEFAATLARVVMWIGQHLATRELGLDEPTLPLKNLDDNIVHGDALLKPWCRPEGELAIVGNPPYLGVRKMRQELGDAYVEDIFERFPNNRAADYVTYWFTQALATLRQDERAGFVCTNSIAQNESREASIDLVLAKGGTLTDAWKSYPWPGEAAVHIGIVNWVMGSYEGIRTLDGQEVAMISPSLTGSEDVSGARTIQRNKGICFMGVTPGNTEFVLTAEQRKEILAADPKSSEVIRPFLVGKDVNREVDQAPTRWIIDFGGMTKTDAEQFRGAMRHVRKHVYGAKTTKSSRKTEGEAGRWWQFVRPRPEMRAAVSSLPRVLVIPCVSPHLIISRQDAATTFDHALMVVALHSRYHFGVLQSRYHEWWAWARCSTLKGDLRYTNTTAFETFPFPLFPDGHYAPSKRPMTDATDRVERASQDFENQRTALCKARQIGLTKVHNLLKAGEEPVLQGAWEKLNDAVTECYGFPKDTWRDDRELQRRLLALNLELAKLSEGYT